VRGADPFRSVLLESQEENTVKTSRNVMRNSIPNPCSTVRVLLRVVSPRLPLNSSGVRPSKIATAQTAPPHCANTNMIARAMLILRATSKEIVTAGLM